MEASGTGSRSIAWMRSEAAGRSSGRFKLLNRFPQLWLSSASSDHAVTQPRTILYAFSYRTLIMAKACREHKRLRQFHPIAIGLAQTEG